MKRKQGGKKDLHRYIDMNVLNQQVQVESRQICILHEERVDHFEWHFSVTTVICADARVSTCIY